MFDLPFDTCCTFLEFGLPLSKWYKTQLEELFSMNGITP